MIAPKPSVVGAVDDHSSLDCDAAKNADLMLKLASAVSSHPSQADGTPRRVMVPIRTDMTGTGRPRYANSYPLPERVSTLMIPRDLGYL